MSRGVLLFAPGFVALLAGCPGAYTDPLAAESGNPDCGTAELGKIMAARALELERACKPVRVEDCHNEQAEAVRAKYGKQLDVWEKCGENEP